MSYGAKFDSDIFVQLLKLNQRQKRHVLPCCFHPDTDPSLAIDLIKGVWFCHGACSEPKGGGPVQFLIRWEKIKNGKEISRQDATRRLRSTFTIPDAREVRKQAMTAELQCFAGYIVKVGAMQRREIDRCLAAFTARGRLRPLTDTEWDDVAFLHRERQWWDERWYACHGVRDVRRLAHYFKEAIALGMWSDEIYVALIMDADERAAAMHTTSHKWLRRTKLEALQWATQQFTEQFAKGKLCRQQSTTTTRTPVPKRTPVIVKTPVA